MGLWVTGRYRPMVFIIHHSYNIYTVKTFGIRALRLSWDVIEKTSLTFSSLLYLVIFIGCLLHLCQSTRERKQHQREQAHTAKDPHSSSLSGEGQKRPSSHCTVEQCKGLISCNLTWHAIQTHRVNTTCCLQKTTASGCKWRITV